MHKLAIKDNKTTKHIYTKQFIILVSCIALLILILIGNLVRLQIFQHKQYATQSRNNVISIIPASPNRGLIYDRNGVILAENVPAYQLTVTPENTPDMRQSIHDLQKIINIPQDNVDNFFSHLYLYRPNQAVPLVNKMSEQQVAAFYTHQYKFPGINIQMHMIRHYPLGKATANVVGYVGRINANEINNVNRENYSATNVIGKTGLEKQYEQVMHGKVGIEEIETNARGRIVKHLQQIHPVSGNNLYLSIDSKLQQAAYNALGNNQGAVVAIDPKNGEILALVSKPSFDPNIFVTGISNKEYNALTNSPYHPLFDRALRGQFAPGSTIKPFYAVEALDNGRITTASKIYDPGWFQLPNTRHIYHDWKLSGHGWVNVTKAIAVSCDTFFYNLAAKTGILQLDRNLYDFGFGKVTNIDLPDELSGLVPTAQWKKQHIGVSWYTGDTIVAGIGQGYLSTTPLQLAYATSILANRGIGYQPHLVTKLQSGNQQQEVQPLVTTSIQLKNPKNWDIVNAAMQQVILNPLGTGENFGRHPAYSVAAKTGTAQVYGKKRDEDRTQTNIPRKLRNNHLFIAYAPVNNPQIAIAVVVEHNVAAARVARKVLDEYLLGEHHAK